VTNVRAPIALDASHSVWPIASADGIICINMVRVDAYRRPGPVANDRPKAVAPLVQILGLQCTEFVERGDYRDFTGSIPLPRIAASAGSDPRKWINR
jgi:hypothetical protein